MATIFGAKIQGTTDEQIAICPKLGITHVRPVAVILSQFNGRAGSQPNIDRLFAAGIKCITNLDWNPGGGVTTFASNLSLYRSQIRSFLSIYASKIFIAVIENEPTNDNFYNDTVDHYLSVLQIAVEECRNYGVTVTDGCTHIELVQQVINGTGGSNQNVADVNTIIQACKTYIPTDLMNLHTKGIGNTYPAGLMKKVADYLRQQTNRPVMSNEWHLVGATQNLINNMVQQWRDAGAVYSLVWGGDPNGSGGDPINNGSNLTTTGIWYRDAIKTVAANQPPVANAGADATITLPANSVSLSGLGSSDPDGTITAYAWSKISGPVTGTITSQNAATTTVTGLIAGIYTFRLTVTDNGGLTATDTKVVTVKANQPPAANPGSNRTITLPTNSVSLSGGGSTDPDGTITAYAWSKISGPAGGAITSPSSVNTTITGLIAGSYVYQLQVTDNGGLTDSKTVTITVNPAPNQPPVANAGGNASITLPTNSIALNGTASSDPDGTIAAYLWTKLSGPTAGVISASTSASTTATGLVAGTYQFQLRVTDNNGATGTDVKIVTVNPVTNQAPIANAGVNQTITLPTSSVTVNGSGSTDDVGITAYLWTGVSGPNTPTITSPNSVSTTITGLISGTYIFNLRVTDGGGLIGNDRIKIIVNSSPPANQPPIANAGTDQSITLPTNSVSITGSGTDADGTVASYAWSKIAGPATFTIVSPTSASTNITGLAQGTYTFRLTVTDNLGATGFDDIDIIVNPAPNQLPTANAGVNKTITLPVNSITLTGSGSDPDGSIASYAWSKIAGPANFTIGSPTASTTNITGLIAGTYTFRLTVTDNQGASGFDDVDVIVNPAPNQPPVAKAGSNRVITLPVNSVSLNGAGSTDPDGTIVSYAWVKISGPASFTIVSPSAATTSVTGLVAGIYKFTLTVTDNNGATNTDTVKVTVNAAVNQPPVANAGTDILITLPVDSCTLNGSGSTDPDGSIISYAWTKISGPAYTIDNPAIANPALTNLLEGTYILQLNIADNNGLTAFDTVTVAVAPVVVSQPPIAFAGYDFEVYLPVGVVRLDGSLSYDPAGSIVSWLWQKTDGGVITEEGLTGPILTLAGFDVGVYTYSLIVTDNDGNQGSSSVTLIVNPNPSAGSFVSAGYGPPRKKFLYYLLNANGLSNYVEAGMIKQSTTPKPLDKTPDGWQNIIVRWERSLKYRGIQRTFTTQLAFIWDGAAILRGLFYGKNIEERIFLLIQRQTLLIEEGFYSFIYKYFYKGEIDLSTYQQNSITAGYKVTANIMEGGLSKLLKAAENIIYEIPCNKSNPECVDIILDGIELVQSLNFIAIEYPDPENLLQLYLNHIIDIAFINNEGDSTGIAYQSQQYENFDNASYPHNSENWLIQTTLDPLTITLAREITVKLYSSIGGTVLHRLFYMTDAVSPYDEVEIGSHILQVGETYTYYLNQSITIPANTKFYIYGRAALTSSGDAQGFKIGYIETNVKATFKTRYRATTIKALFPYDLFKALVLDFAGPTYQAASILLDQYKNLAVTCGNAIRGLSDAVIKTTITNFFNSFSVILNAGLSISGKIIEMESLTKYFDASDPINLGEITNLVIEPAKDYIFNSVKLGYPLQNYETLNGKQEYNTNMQFNSAITRIAKELALLSDYRTDCYGIEKIRTNFDGKTTTDASSDNDTFIINVALTSETRQEFDAAKATPQNYNTEATLNFNTVTGINFIANIDKTAFTFIPAVAGNVEVNLGISTNSPDMSVLNIKIYQNAIIIQSLMTIASNATDVLDTTVLLASNDVIKVIITNTTGTTFTVGHATLELKLTTAPAYRVLRETYDSVTGLISPATVYNIAQLTPKRLLLNNGNLIHSMFYGFEDQYLNFQTTDKNYALKTVKAGVTIEEKANVRISDLAAKLFEPFVFTFTTKVPADLVDLLELNPNRCFIFVYRGNTYKGFNLSVGISPNDNKEQEFKLLSAPNNDLTKLING